MIAELHTMKLLLYIGVLCVGASGKAEESDLPDVSRENPEAGNTLTDVDKADYDTRSNIIKIKVKLLSHLFLLLASFKHKLCSLQA